MYLGNFIASFENCFFFVQNSLLKFVVENFNLMLVLKRSGVEIQFHTNVIQRNKGIHNSLLTLTMQAQVGIFEYKAFIMSDINSS